MSTPLFGQVKSTKRKLVEWGVFYVELNSFFKKHVEDYQGFQLRPYVNKVEIIVRTTRTTLFLGEKGKNIREYESIINKRWGGVIYFELFAERVANRTINASFVAESLKFKLLCGLNLQRACFAMIRFVMESSLVDGIHIIISGKVSGERAKITQYKEGQMIHSGNIRDHVQEGKAHFVTR
eukprot:TRINITY_DN1983_c0_g1_i3.p1 TRINITY_DN1983_c0_g1~~TRINITY_DN1983_c0_g1_i3.p1  ORF type:complete len:181 (+),score=15.05 TRINITY_DN1983_c0_g1_i3:255-797(+)